MKIKFGLYNQNVLNNRQKNKLKNNPSKKRNI